MAESSKVFGLFWGLLLSSLLVVNAVNRQFDGACYLKYDAASKSQTTSEVIKFRFKTVQVSGLILFAGKAEKYADYLVVELVGGMIRYHAMFGATSDAEKSSMEVFVGRNLADNQWHTVNIERDKGEVNIDVDMYRDRWASGQDTMQLGFSELTVEDFYIGGVPESLANVRSELKYVLSVPNYHGCVEDLKYNAGGSTLELLGNDVTAVGGCPEGQCKSITYKPFTFPDKDSHLKVSTREDSELKGSLFFHTYNPYGVLVEQRQNGNPAVKISFSQSGVRLDGYKNGYLSDSVVLTWKSNKKVDDGSWRKVEFRVTKNLLTLKVDDAFGDNEKSTSYTVTFSDTIYLGDGFVGCMKDLMIDGKSINPNDLRSEQRKGVILDKCESYDLCIPNPCMNGGKCSQENGMLTCDCSASAYSGSVCQFADDPLNCAMKKELDPASTSGDYMIDPDNSGPLPRMKVKCDMNANPPETTIDSLGLSNKKVKSDDDGTVYVMAKYSTSLAGARAVALRSKSCKQFIKYECINSRLMTNNKTYSFWLDYSGSSHYNWGGANRGKRECGCNVDNTCASDMICNCFEKSASKRVDEGDLTEKEFLPVSQVQFTDVGPGSDSSLTLGALICSGQETADYGVTFLYEDSLITLPPWTPSTTGDISLDFKTPYPKGILLDNRGAAGDFFQLRISRSNSMLLAYSFGKGHSDTIEITLEDKTLSDSEWHSVQLYHNVKEFVLVVDGVKKVRSTSQTGHRLLDLHDPLYVGSYLPDVVNGFIGCMRRLVINGVVIDMTKKVHPKNTYLKKGCQGACSPKACVSGECVDKYNMYACDCSKTPYVGDFCHKEEMGATFSGDSRMEYKDFKLSFNSEEETIVLGFKASSCDKTQTLVYVENAAESDFIEVKLNTDGKLQLTYKNDITLSDNSLCDGKRHSVYVKIDLNSITYSIDNGELSSQQFFGSVFVKFAVVYVGNNKPKDRPFKGCITGVKVMFAGSGNKVSVKPIESFFNKGNTATGISKGKCAPDIEPPVTPTPHIPTSLHTKNGESGGGPDKGARTNEGEDSSAVIIVVVVLLVLLIVLLLVAIVWFMARNKGVYNTHEGDEDALKLDDQNVALAGSQPGDGKKKEWYI